MNVVEFFDFYDFLFFWICWIFGFFGFLFFGLFLGFFELFWIFYSWRLRPYASRFQRPRPESRESLQSHCLCSFCDRHSIDPLNGRASFPGREEISLRDRHRSLFRHVYARGDPPRERIFVVYCGRDDSWRAIIQAPRLYAAVQYSPAFALAPLYMDD